jgi:hypothetical protein
LFDDQISDDEALELFRTRKASGTHEEVMFMASREMVFTIERQNGLVGQMQATLNKHLDRHPASELVQGHLDDARDAAVTARFIKRAGGVGTAGLALLVAGFGLVLTVLQIVELASR